ncbi:hypothetical protein ACZ90_13075 [Streptomyces albus subsp. albus]|nr:hypothetical protein ACZ90_13075 [Streptomyces albus subsp. albus]
MDFFYAATGLDRQEPIRDVVRSVRGLRGHLVPLVLSVAVREGVPLGTGSEDELRRMRGRVDDYRALAALLASAVPGARVLKGSSLAGAYPPEVLRPSGDLDMYVPDEPALWRAVAEVFRVRPVHDVDVTVLGDGARVHWVVVLRWPAQDPVLDIDHRIELVTFAYPGADGGPPLRAEPPRDQATADLLAIAEEAFQRPFTVKDLLDLAFTLGGAHRPPLPELVQAADAYRLAPELLGLSERLRAAAHLPCPANDRLPALLSAPAARELAARRRGERRSRPAGPWTGPSCLAGGGPLHGLRLTPAPAHRPGAEVRFHTFPEGVLLRCPVGDFLLVASELVDPRGYQAAVEALQDLCAAEEAGS